MNQQLGVLDRATLTVWRFVNVAGWTALAFVVAQAVHVFLTLFLTSRAALSALAFDLNVRPGAEEGVDDLIAKFGLRIGLTLLIAFLVGSIVGRRVWKRQAFYAGVAAAIYVAYTLIAWEQSTATGVFSDFGNGVTENIIRRTNVYLSIVYDLIVASTIAIASWTARRVAARRPAIPDLARLAQEVPDDGVPQLGR